MKTEIIKDIRQGFETAYINGTLASNLEYKPSFVSNNPKEGKKVISTIEDLLEQHTFLKERNGKQSALGYQPDIWKGWN